MMMGGTAQPGASTCLEQALKYGINGRWRSGQWYDCGSRLRPDEPHQLYLSLHPASPSLAAHKP
eukprot:1033739-Pelagomonas_calceolata.AAC.5